MGVFYYVHAVALAEDIPEVEKPHNASDLDRFYSDVDRGYTQVNVIFP